MITDEPMPPLPLAELAQQLAQRHSLDLATPGAGLFIEAPPHGDLVIAVWDDERRYSLGRTLYTDGQPAPGFSLYYNADWQPLAAFNDFGQPVSVDEAEVEMRGLIERLYWRSPSAHLVQLDGGTDQYL